ncbi:MAG TPA: Fic family protein [Myxococcales bacterium]|nr:Fic family protein [Myxococcales bacterium]
MSELVKPEDIITSSELIALHDEALEKYKGRPGILHEGCVERTIAAAWHAEEYAGSEVPGLVLAGFLLYYLTTDHCFRDGNKRGGWMAAIRVLSHFDLTVEADTDTVYEFVCECARGRAGTVGGGEAVVRWLTDRIVALPS